MTVRRPGRDECGLNTGTTWALWLLITAFSFPLQVRAGADAVMGLGARQHSVALLLAGAAVTAVGWSHAVWPRRPAPA
jgi:hypothetical protein